MIAPTLILPVVPYRCLLLDPSWPERGGGKVKRGADRHYQLLDKPGAVEVPQILSTVLLSPLWHPARDAAHLWCWATDNYLPAALWLIGKLDFVYKRTFVWVKTRGEMDVEQLEDEDLFGGIGQYGRGAHELLLFATRGSGKSSLVYQDRRDVKSVLVAPHERNEAGKVIHSRKPKASYDLIERRSKGPYAELFARCGRPGWVAWGNEYEDGAEAAHA